MKAVTSLDIDDLAALATPTIDVAFATLTGIAVDAASILDAAAEVELFGPGAANVAISGTPISLGGGVYRYALSKKVASKPLFDTAAGAGRTLSLRVLKNAYKDTQGHDTADTLTPTSEDVPVGPFVLEGPSIGIADVNLTPAGVLVVTVGIGADLAGLNFGSGTFTTELEEDPRQLRRRRRPHGARWPRRHPRRLQPARPLGHAHR